MATTKSGAKVISKLQNNGPTHYLSMSWYRNDKGNLKLIKLMKAY